ncbi:MAG: HigA family addiction module antitoxin [Corynebacterium sp.]|uniref:HigA family addiction module antitoxin n=1 Tax=Corynebacterium TaxID=1716 RepID=UPI0026495165|nr:HigA family addiction module antitoxin [Corynebacterium sp.]MDN5722944.1 HigA family addiction module antitoxin [Corynebacterium sp.]MDN6281837.1 HigA family addiction module antitoxin [Corynebacterium sp.]MDN6305540.1 HigA family addiction module antitoxin [Corynebacterium sp.]MDN6352356.1 HigA family addiction module antitoxin [Corynebacterium sp.]MDN6367698.1 HigA family addiction module antitoxin [Corynebacterium sp.]
MIESPLAEHFPAGEYLADELDERGWSHADFANIIDCPTPFVSDVVNGREMITRESAVQFAAALGTTPGLWLNLQDSYLQQRRAPTFNTSGAPENPDGHA